LGVDVLFDIVEREKKKTKALLTLAIEDAVIFEG
jgi:hypothetical protein